MFSVEQEILSFFVLMIFYAAYCIFWAAKSASLNKDSVDFFIGGRKLPLWISVTAITGCIFSGIYFFGLPELIARDGLSANYLGLGTITVSLAGLLFFKRWWMASKRYGFVTIGELFRYYFQDDFPVLYSWLLSLIFGIAFVSFSLNLAGYFVSVATENFIDIRLFSFFTLSLTVIYVTAGGIGAIVRISSLQMILTALTLILAGAVAIELIGGFGNLNSLLASVKESSVWGTTKGYGGGNYNNFFALAGVIQWADGQGIENPSGGIWTGVMVLSITIGMTGAILTPHFSLLAASSDNSKNFARAFLWGVSIVVGILLLFFVASEGLTGLILKNAVPPNLESLQQIENSTELISIGFIRMIGALSPWFYGLLLTGAVISVTIAAGLYLHGLGTVTARDIVKRYFYISASDIQQKKIHRVTILISATLAFFAGIYAKNAVVLFVEIGLSLSVQLFPTYLAVFWFPWIKTPAIKAGLILGTIGVVATSPLGMQLTDNYLIWGYWPWTIHSSIWGLFFNFVTVIAVSLTSNFSDRRQNEFHSFLNKHSALPASKKRMVTFSRVAVFVWFFFGVGPGAIIGNYAFGEPINDIGEWYFSMPSIWVWQLLWWGIGCLLVWFLGYKMELAIEPRLKILPLQRDIRKRKI